MGFYRKMMGVILIGGLFAGAGFLVGFQTHSYFYPGTKGMEPNEHQMHIDLPAPSANLPENPSGGGLSEDAKAYGIALTTATSEETLCVDTKYLLQEVDLRSGRTEETVSKLPIQYVGMNREQFLEAMNTYQVSPPLQEMERGFQQLEVSAFSREQVTVKMYYEYIQPTPCFYVAAYDNRVVVYLEDKKTIYIDTGIPLDSLPEELKMMVINMYKIEDESILFGFLENYTS